MRRIVVAAGAAVCLVAASGGSAGALFLGSAADLSIVSSVTAPLAALEPATVWPPKKRSAGAGRHAIPIPEGCPKTTVKGADVGVNGDGDGDGAADDRQLDINGRAAGKAERAPNGDLELWCINPQAANPTRGFYALQWDPAGPAGPRFIGKCPFKTGRCKGWKYINPRTGHVEEIEWTSLDAGEDDDKDGKIDAWQYNYDTGADTFLQKHFEDGVLQGDGKAAQAPPTRPFKFGDLLPKNPGVDNPTLAAVTLSEDDHAAMTGLYVEVPLGAAFEASILTVIANEGPKGHALAASLITLWAPDGCTVDGSNTAVRRRPATLVGVGRLRMLRDAFSLSCSQAGVQVFTVESRVANAIGAGMDPMPADDASVMTLDVMV